MTPLMRSLSILCLPVAFFAAGGGMLWLYRVRAADGGFYDRILNHSADWIGSHVVLLVGAMLVIPAAITLARAIGTGRGSRFAAVGLLMAIPGAMLLGGQYAIDFTMPLIAEAGGEALTVHQRFFTTEPLNTLFYVLPDLSSLGLLMLTFGLLRSGRCSRGEAAAMVAVWLLVIGGAAIHVVAQRIALFALGFTYLPEVRRQLGTEPSPI